MPACTNAKVPFPYDHYVHEPSQYAPKMHWHLVPPLRSLYTRSASGPRDHPRYDPQHNGLPQYDRSTWTYKAKNITPIRAKLSRHLAYGPGTTLCRQYGPGTWTYEAKNITANTSQETPSGNPTEQDQRQTHPPPYVLLPRARRATSKFTCRPARRHPIRNPEAIIRYQS